MLISLLENSFTLEHLIEFFGTVFLCSVKLIREKEWKSFKDSETSPEVGDYVLVDTWNGWMRGKIEKLKDDVSLLSYLYNSDFSFVKKSFISVCLLPPKVC